MAIKIRLAIICVTGFLISVFPVSPALAATKSCPQFEPLFKKYGLLPVKEFSYIAWRESRCRIKAINATWDANGKMTWHLNKNGTYDSGLLQINSGHAGHVRKVCNGGLPKLLTLDCNLKMGKFLLDNGGLAHWRFSAPTTTTTTIPVDGYKRN
jgi:hypothetical protein